MGAEVGRGSLVDGRAFWVRLVGSWVLKSNNVVAEALAVSLDKPLEWAVGLVDVVQLVAPGHKFVQRELAFSVPTEEHWEILVGVGSSQTTPVLALVGYEQSGIYADVPTRQTDQDGHSAVIVSTGSAAPRGG